MKKRVGILGMLGILGILGILVAKHPLFKYSTSYIFDSSDRTIREIVERNISGKKGSYAVIVKSLWEGSDIHYSYNEKEVYPSASLYKLFLMAEVFDQIEQGKLKEEDILKAQSAQIAGILGEEDIHKATLEFTVGEALNRVTYFSDNYAAIMLAEKVGWDNIQNQTSKIGATATNIRNPISTNALDIATFLEKLNKGEVVSRKASDSIMEKLTKAEINDRIPAGIKSSVVSRQSSDSLKAEAQAGLKTDSLPKVAHKTGELSKVRHDAGIVFLEGKPYLIVLMSKDLQYEDEGTEILANISKEVFDYIKSK